LGLLQFLKFFSFLPGVRLIAHILLGFFAFRILDFFE